MTPLKESDFRPSAEHFRVLGELTYEYSALSDVVGRCIATLLSQDRMIGDIVCAGVPFRRQLDLLGCLVRHRYGDSKVARDAAEAIQAADGAAAERNTIVHSVWLLRFAQGTQESPGHAYLTTTARRKKGLQYRTEPAGPDDLRSTAMKLNAATVALLDLEGRFDCQSVDKPYVEQARRRR